MAAPEGLSDKVAFVSKVADKLRGYFTPTSTAPSCCLLAPRRLANAAGLHVSPDSTLV